MLLKDNSDTEEKEAKKVLPSQAGHEGSHNIRTKGRVEIEADLCKGCLLCIDVCPPKVLVVSNELNKMGYHPVTYIGEKCTGCGICFYVCPEPGSIRVYKRIQAISG